MRYHATILKAAILTGLFLVIVPAWGVPAGNGHDSPQLRQEQSGDTDTIWTCSMHPQIQLPEPGQCPICFMDLIQVKKKKKGHRLSLRQITFDDRARKLARVEVQPVIRGSAATTVRMVGKVDYDETRLATITSWVNGRIDKLFVDYTGSRVRAGQPMAEVYSPELLTAQAELIQAVAAFNRSRASGNRIITKTARRTMEASREKLRLLGLNDDQIRAMEKQGRPTDHITLTAPLSGIVIRKEVNEGMYVKTGSRIYTVADLDRVWVILEAYESDLHAISLGQQVRFTVEAYPGRTFRGEVAYIDPLVNERTRTTRVRLDVDNRDGSLKPGMFVRAVAAGSGRQDSDPPILLIPASAPLITGKRALVYVQPPGRETTYVGREVILGPRRGDYYQVKSGLAEGELVVTRGNFKIDSAIQIQAGPSLMNPYQDRSGKQRQLPGLFLSRLILLNQSFADLSAAIHQDDDQRRTMALKRFSDTLAAIDGKDLAGDDRLQWREMAMLLGNDIILLTEAATPAEARELYADMAEHFLVLRTSYGLSDVQASRLGNEELRTMITRFVSGYLDLQRALSADDLAGARQAGAGLAAQTEQLTAALDNSGFDRGSALATRLESKIREIGQATTLEAVRTVFYPLSQVLADIVQTFGVAGDQPLYVQFCPMAFDNKGATWLAPSEEINNPYFGAAMLHCGEVRQQLSR